MDRLSLKFIWLVTKDKLYKNITFSKKLKKEKWWKLEYLKVQTKAYQALFVVENQPLSLNLNFY